jgi:hypothetical protein
MEYLNDNTNNTNNELYVELIKSESKPYIYNGTKLVSSAKPFCDRLETSTSS